MKKEEFKKMLKYFGEHNKKFPTDPLSNLYFTVGWIKHNKEKITGEQLEELLNIAEDKTIKLSYRLHGEKGKQ